MNLDGFKAMIRSIVRQETRRIDWLALYPAKVLKDHGDNTFDLEADDARLGKPVKVPLRLFLPGVKVEVEPGARVLLGFEGGTPDKPVAYLWETGTLKKLTVVAETQVLVECPEVLLGGEAATFVALANQTDARLDALESDWGQSKTTLIAAVGAMVPPLGAPFVAGGAPPGGTTAAEKVKAE